MKRAEFKKLNQIGSLLHIAHCMLHEEDTITQETYDTLIQPLEKITGKVTTLVQTYNKEE